jgi:hypothetical protein
VTDRQTHPEDPAPKTDEKDAATKKDGRSEADHKRPDSAPTDPEKARTVHGDEETVV